MQARLRIRPQAAQPMVAPSPAMAALQPPIHRAPPADYSNYTFGVFFEDLTGSGGTGQQQLIIDNDADFDWHASTYVASADPIQDYTDSTRLIPAITLDIQTQDTQRISNIPLPLGVWFGDGRLPLVLPAVRRLARRTVVTFNATNLGSSTLNLWLGLIGKKVYA